MAKFDSWNWCTGHISSSRNKKLSNIATYICHFLGSLRIRFECSLWVIGKKKKALFQNSNRFGSHRKIYFSISRSLSSSLGGNKYDVNLPESIAAISYVPDIATKIDVPNVVKLFVVAVQNQLSPSKIFVPVLWSNTVMENIFMISSDCVLLYSLVLKRQHPEH